MGMKSTIKSEIFSLLQNYPESLRFIESLSEIGELLFFGGSIRDYYIYNEYKNMPRDFDIAVKLNPKNEGLFKTFIEQYEFKKNRFGGYKVRIEGIEFDLWNLQNTWAFKERKLVVGEQNLIKSVFLSVDGIAYNFNNDTLYDDELKRSIENKQINVVLKDNPQKELNLLRALVFKKKYKFELSKDLKEEYRRSFKIHTNLHEVLHELQFSHYNCEYLTKNEVFNELEYVK
ncbi:hypothetical protein ABH17_026920 (plasmid) [Bacillus toyonensis]|uniref:hypothetical protein n=1 Tax=Bacillus toyonensis TaxID=155322 RepID=UPI0006AA393F|nr:hypothetical protein [Bacillus toyonensis]OKO50954.1 hypothetical protein ABH17_026920 [Bacillus toyonensis]